MESFQTIEQALENDYKDQVMARLTSSWKGVSILVLGIAIFAILGFNWDAKSIVPPIAITIGTTICIIGLATLLIRKKHFYGIANRQRLKTHELHFNISETDKLVQSHTLDSFSNLKSLKRSISNGLTLRIMLTQDREVCFTQVIGYVPFEHNTLTEVKRQNKRNTLLISALIK